MRMLWPVFAPGLISGCMLGSGYDYRNDYSEYRRIGSEGWRYADTLAFTPVHADTVCRGSLVVALRHDESYPYDELWLEVMTENQDGDNGNVARLCHDTLRIVLADRVGSWRGDGIGGSFQLTDTLPDVVHRSGTPVMVKHIMRVDTLTGVNQVGVFFKRR